MGTTEELSLSEADCEAVETAEEGLSLSVADGVVEGAAVEETGSRIETDAD